MLYREISKVLAYYMFLFAGALLVPLFVAAYYEFHVPAAQHPQPHTTIHFAYSIAICLAMALLFLVFSRGSTGQLYRREGIAVTVFIWFLSAFVGALPFYISGTLPTFADAYFETMSGFTATGASVIQPREYDPQTGKEIASKRSQYSDQLTYTFYGTVTPVRDPKTGQITHQGVEAVGKGMLFWRSFTQWLGGMGIVVLFVAVLPMLRLGGKVLYQTEATGPIKENMTPRIKETAGVLWKIYLFFTTLQIILLIATNPKLELYHAVVIACSTIATGGFSVLNDSLGGYHNLWTEIIVMIFMVVGSINFVLFFHCLRGKFYRLYEPEFVTYLLILLFICAVSSWDLVGKPYDGSDGQSHKVFSIGEAIRYGSFQVISAITTTGFFTANYDHWPYLTQVLMLVIMFVGGMSGSTSAGIKVLRLILSFRIVKNAVESIFRPDTVRRLTVANKTITHETSITVLSFFVTVTAIAILSTFLFVLDGVDSETALGIVACEMNGVGLAFRMAGPNESFAFLSTQSKYLCSLLMVLGRLEYFALLVMLFPRFWKKT